MSLSVSICLRAETLRERAYVLALQAADLNCQCATDPAQRCLYLEARAEAERAEADLINHYRTCGCAATR